MWLSLGDHAMSYDLCVHADYATIDGHKWHATRCAAFRADVVLPREADVSASWWLTPGRFTRSVTRWLSNTPTHIMVAYPFHRRFAGLFEKYKVVGGAGDSIIALQDEDREYVAFIIGLDRHHRNFDPTQAITQTGAPWPGSETQ